MTIPTRLFNFNGLPPSNGLVAAWNLSAVTDSFGANNLTNNNVVTFTAGKINNAATFNGVNQYLSIADNTDISIGTLKKFTACGWFKATTLTAGTFPGLFSKWNNVGNQAEWLLRINVDLASLEWFVTKDGISGGATGLSIGTGLINVNVWYFLVIWYDGQKLYAELNNNGTIYSTTYVNDIFNGTSVLQLGHSVTDADYFTGQLDAWRLYKSSTRVLSAAERSLLYNNGNGREYIANTIRSSDEVNREFDQIINIVNGITQDAGIVIRPTDANNPALIINQNGAGPIAQFYINNILKLEVTNLGQIKSLVATGTAPFALSSSNLVDNLNVDLLDDLDSDDILQITSYLTFCDSGFFDGIPSSGDRVIVPVHSDSLVQVKLQIRGTASSNATLLVTVMKDVEFEEVITTISLLGNSQDVVTVNIAETLGVERLIFEITIIAGTTKHSDITVSAITKSSPF